jgi:hypothetical protein
MAMKKIEEKGRHLDEGGSMGPDGDLKDGDLKDGDLQLSVH